MTMPATIEFEHDIPAGSDAEGSRQVFNTVASLAEPIAITRSARLALAVSLL
jgi:hypothetical protein